jgi:hypothetical protein
LPLSYLTTRPAAMQAHRIIAPLSGGIAASPLIAGPLGLNPSFPLLRAETTLNASASPIRSVQNLARSLTFSAGPPRSSNPARGGQKPAEEHTAAFWHRVHVDGKRQKIRLVKDVPDNDLAAQRTPTDLLARPARLLPTVGETPRRRRAKEREIGRLEIERWAHNNITTASVVKRHDQVRLIHDDNTKAHTHESHMPAHPGSTSSASDVTSDHLIAQVRQICAALNMVEARCAELESIQASIVRNMWQEDDTIESEQGRPLARNGSQRSPTLDFVDSANPDLGLSDALETERAHRKDSSILEQIIRLLTRTAELEARGGAISQQCDPVTHSSLTQNIDPSERQLVLTRRKPWYADLQDVRPTLYDHPAVLAQHFSVAGGDGFVP